MTSDAIKPTEPFWRCWTTLESGEPFDSIKAFLKYISKATSKGGAADRFGGFSTRSRCSVTDIQWQFPGKSKQIKRHSTGC